jgi:hypothetical protein
MATSPLYWSAQLTRCCRFSLRIATGRARGENSTTEKKSSPAQCDFKNLTNRCAKNRSEMSLCAQTRREKLEQNSVEKRTTQTGPARTIEENIKRVPRVHAQVQFFFSLTLCARECLTLFVGAKDQVFLS